MGTKLFCYHTCSEDFCTVVTLVTKTRAVSSCVADDGATALKPHAWLEACDTICYRMNRSTTSGTPCGSNYGRFSVLRGILSLELFFAGSVWWVGGCAAAICEIQIPHFAREKERDVAD